MAKDDKKIDEVDGIPREREGTRPDFSVPPPRKKLPKDMQATLDNEEKMWEIMYDGRYVYTLLVHVIHQHMSPPSSTHDRNLMDIQE
jgi:hypothetical protein